jgi:hypothetical protein
MSTPSVAQMPPERFGPNQIKAFIERMSTDIFRNLSQKPIVTVHEDATVTMEILAPSIKWTIYQVGPGRWQYTQDCPFGGGRRDVSISHYMDALSLIKEMLSQLLQVEMVDWFISNYDCTA